MFKYDMYNGDDNKITIKGVEQLTKAYLPKLQSLTLDYNKIGNEGLILLL